MVSLLESCSYLLKPSTPAILCQRRYEGYSQIDRQHVTLAGYHQVFFTTFGARKGWTLRYSTVIQSSMMVKQRLCYQRYRATFGTVLLCWMLDNIEDYRHSTPTQPNTPSPSLPPQPFCTSSLLSSPCPPAFHSPEIAISFNGTVNPHSASLNTI
jgi:hypothetical protein